MNSGSFIYYFKQNVNGISNFLGATISMERKQLLVYLITCITLLYSWLYTSHVCMLSSPSTPRGPVDLRGKKRFFEFCFQFDGTTLPLWRTEQKGLKLQWFLSAHRDRCISNCISAGKGGLCHSCRAMEKHSQQTQVWITAERTQMFTV